MRSEDEQYFERIEAGLTAAIEVATRARERGGDPNDSVEIPVARDMADRVENILGIDGVAEHVRALEADPDTTREEAALELTRTFAEDEVGDYETDAGRIEGAVRTAVALLTEGVVAAPIEGIDRVEVHENDDGSEFVNVYYAGPIRSAGGTAQALSVLVADYARTLLGLAEYKPREVEVGRYAEELALYDDETGLQYAPSDEETKFIARNVPVMLDGEPTGEEEVSGYRDLDRVATNKARGGMCLVLGEGIAQKAPKIQRYTSTLDEVSWPWLDRLIQGNTGTTDTDDASGAPESSEVHGTTDAGAEPDRPPRPAPSKKFLEDLIAGRPVFSHPSEPGGFRLRYGRARNHGFATAGIHPATMHLVDDFLATGTQIKTERPGKAAGVVPVDSIEGPTVRLADGTVRRIDDPAEALEVRNGVEEIIDLGEYLVNYGEFVENNQPLAPASYSVEWWIQDLAAAGADVQALRDAPHVDLSAPDADEALAWACEYDAPLHPSYTYLWHDVPVEAFEALADAVEEGRFAESDGAATTEPSTAGATLILPSTAAVRETLETLLVEHTQGQETVTVPDAMPLVRSLGFTADLERTWESLPEPVRGWDGGDSSMRAVEKVAPFAVEERAPTRVGNRMGRPEKSEKRELTPAVHTLFPLGEAGGDQRDVSAAADYSGEGPRGGVHVEVARRECPGCGEHSYRTRCPDCGSGTEPHYECPGCEIPVEADGGGDPTCPRCGTATSAVEYRRIDVNGALHDALAAVGERENTFDILKGVKGLTSAAKIPEPLEKGVLRAKNGVSAFKDGTVRYDMTDLPVTSVRPAELDVTADRLRELGYHEDVNGEPLKHDDQLVELKVQDVVLSDGAAEHMLKTAAFVDDLLGQYYGLDPFYELNDRDDLVGELVFGMAPHTSAAVVGRVIGFTSASVGYAHPYFHAAKRRNCFHPETKLWYRDEDGAWRYEPVESFVESRLEAPREDDFGTTVQDLDGGIVVPSITEDGDIVNQPVTALSKHQSPDHLIRIETRRGSEITVTPDHKLHVYEDGGIRSKRASAVEAADLIVRPRHLDTVEPSDTPPRFDLLAEFLRGDEVANDRLTVKGLGKTARDELFETVLGDEGEGDISPWQQTPSLCGQSKLTLTAFRHRDGFPVDVLVELFDTERALLAFVPDDVRLELDRAGRDIARHVTVNERVAILLGYYAADGVIRAQDTPQGTIHRMTIRGVESEIRAFLADVFRDEFGVEPASENESAVTVEGRLLGVFFDVVLAAGTEAGTKRVPPCLFDAPDAALAGFLRGYFCGGGTIDRTAPEVSARTVSTELKEDLVALLTRLGIVAHVAVKDPVAPHQEVPDATGPDGGTMAGRSYVIRLTAEDAVQFADEVGVHRSRTDGARSDQLAGIEPRGRPVSDGGGRDYLVDPVTTHEYVESEADHTYCLTVPGTHSLVANDTSQKQCDGDEDCVMLLMDGLLNFSKAYLPDQRGGSVAEDSRLVAVDPAGSVRFMTFEEFWEALDQPVHRDGKFEKRFIDRSGWQTYVFDEANSADLRPIQRAIRYEADDETTLLRVETQFGRSLEITENHSLFRYDDGIQEVAGADLNEGDLVVAPRRLEVETNHSTIDVTEWLEEPYVHVDAQVEDLLTIAAETATGRSQASQQLAATPLAQHSGGKIRYNRLQDRLKPAGLRVPEDVMIGLEESSEGLSRTITVDEEFAWLLGWFLAESTRGTDSTSNAPIHQPVVEHTTRVLRRLRSVEQDRPPATHSNDPELSGVVRQVVIGLCSEAGPGDSVTAVPECIRTAPEDVVGEFLRGFLGVVDGDQVPVDGPSIGFHTESETVKDGLVFLLHRLGCVPDVSERPSTEGTRRVAYSIRLADSRHLNRILAGDVGAGNDIGLASQDALADVRGMDSDGVSGPIPDDLEEGIPDSVETGREAVAVLEDRDLTEAERSAVDGIRPPVDGDLSYLRVEHIEPVEYAGHLYDLQVGGEPVFTANWLYAHNSMDAPLVMSSRVDPTEIDDEAHNIDIVDQYPREFYAATREMADPETVDIAIAAQTLGTDDQYQGFRHTHDTSDIAAGPDLSAYKTLGSMIEKMDAQLELARKLRAVDETDVAERIIEYHFLPDLIGNLRAFTRQETRCLDCGAKYRRVPLSGACRECGGNVNLTVHEGSVSKYMDTASRVAEEFGCREYTKLRLEILERRLDRIFEDDTNRPSTLAEYM